MFGGVDGGRHDGSCVVVRLIGSYDTPISQADLVDHAGTTHSLIYQGRSHLRDLW